MHNRFSHRLATAVGLFALVAGALTVGPSATAAPSTDLRGQVLYTDQETVIEGSYLVGLKAKPEDVDRMADELTSKYNARKGFTYTAALQGFAAEMSKDAAERMAAEPGVDYVAADQMMSIDTFVQTPVPSWGIDRIDEHSLPLDNKYHYPSTANTVRAFVIDTGILMTHNEFGGRASCGFDPYAGGCAPCGQIHGTHVAGTIGGATVGVAKGIQIISVRVFGCVPSAPATTVIAGVNYVTLAQTITPTARSVANMSLGGGLFPPLDAAVTTSINTNVHYSVSAGNSNVNACTQSPAATPLATTVGATDINDNRAVFSNFGPCVDLFAPGVNIVSSVSTANNAYAALSGTSMSSPHAAGVAALWRHRFPTDTAVQVAAALAANATPGVVINPGVGSPNLLLFSNMIPM